MIVAVSERILKAALKQPSSPEYQWQSLKEEPDGGFSARSYDGHEKKSRPKPSLPPSQTHEAYYHNGDMHGCPRPCLPMAGATTAGCFAVLVFGCVWAGLVGHNMPSHKQVLSKN